MLHVCSPQKLRLQALGILGCANPRGSFCISMLRCDLGKWYVLLCESVIKLKFLQVSVGLSLALPLQDAPSMFTCATT